MRELKTRRIRAFALTIFCSAFVVVGATKLARTLRSVWPHLEEASCSIDQEIGGLTGLDHGSERIAQTLAALPRKSRLVILLPKSDASSAYFASMVAYSAWPRQVDAFEIEPGGAIARLRSLDLKTVAALLFVRVPPPSFVPRGVQWAEGIVFVPAPTQP